ncbi:ribonucleotide reductase class Ia beta subunit [Pseudomonas phage PspYZU05]|uniref:ribonucleoside-diphosphate reductase n=1 Tax=Pseudomonas phage PspYZU05 TaxID=1983556 RepID=A0A2U7N4Y8_9CAUD|nr:ribonucleotide reductase class Ia beta subunit [Pseudomonas phage PspYZU05]ASD51966.1 ribonucleotide-diphosphate reductase subunit beta [Pseudomonas phage PspYZU05]
MSTVFNTTPVNVLTEPMFLGSGLGIARYDIQRHRVFEELIEKQLSFFWRPEEVNLTTDKAQFDKLPEYQKNIFTLNLKYQSLLDSIQGRAPMNVFGRLVSDPTLDTWFTTWTFSETIHSRSYLHIMRNVYNDPTKVFDEIVLNKDIMARAVSIGTYYDNVTELEQTYNYYQRSYNAMITEISMTDYSEDSILYAELERELLQEQENLDNAKYQLLRAMYLCMHAVNALEAIRFYVSFACTWNFHKNMSIMEGNTKVMKLIARDEQLHLKGTQYIIRQWQLGTDGEVYKQIAEECKEEAAQIFLDVSEQEKQWVRVLFKDGDVPGLNVTVLDKFIDYLTASRMNAVNLPHNIDAPKVHPLPWIREYLNSDMVQSAPQEVEISSYLVSQIDNDLDKDSLAKLREQYQ